MNRGKLVILFIFGLSTAMGVYAWWHNFQQGRRCLALWGSDAATLIRFAPQVEILELAPPASDASDQPTLQFSEQTFSIVHAKDITAVRGLIHARQSLIEDATFDWNASSRASGRHEDWQYAMRFTAADRTATLVFDRAGSHVRLIPLEREGVLRPERAQAFQLRLPQWLGKEAS